MATDVFFIFERKAVKALIGPALSPAAIDRVLREAQLDSLVFSDSGYALVVAHSDLASLKGKFELPLVQGQHEGVQVRFTAAIRGQTLRLRCRAVSGSQPLPSDIRELDIEITVSQLRDSAGPGGS